ncbi:type II toxin-antitoxin system PemK/MazF family toxin [Marinobacter persicus]|uniref:mRNA interferase MazF n=1 Tax=Marinobacter persicus TaxID=930118 RepID=A0A2S6G638_9GAMM|nr:type II toxin-antitoxin system PemK/MazF family toxin [Marinobacter persicus]PPK51339.1 mRNA interferase MazF [Marinobacter persicus]PPK54592.1 mRNA interferase MazF [Marinobacter persicus]PPK58018.1 mRNA interferase MazF [Marinobacter persicus]
MDVEQGELVLCEFHFSDLGASKRRPVIVFRDNLPFDDFVGIPVSSKTSTLHKDEFLLEPEDMSEGALPKRSKVMVRKTLVISKAVITKKYGKLTLGRFQKLHSDFCKYFDCCSSS